MLLNDGAHLSAGQFWAAGRDFRPTRQRVCRRRRKSFRNSHLRCTLVFSSAACLAWRWRLWAGFPASGRPWQARCDQSRRDPLPARSRAAVREYPVARCRGPVAFSRLHRETAVRRIHHGLPIARSRSMRIARRPAVAIAGDVGGFPAPKCRGIDPGDGWPGPGEKRRIPVRRSFGLSQSHPTTRVHIHARASRHESSVHPVRHEATA